MKSACVIGSPIKHSRSPLIHNYWIKMLNLDAYYDRREVSPAELPMFFAEVGQKGLVGCNITLPHKEQAAALIRNQDDKVRRSGSGNTAYVKNRELHLTSTDGEGFIENLKWRIPGLTLQDMHVLILGAGGSARALVDALLREKVGTITIANRTPARAVAIANWFDDAISTIDLSSLEKSFPRVELLINTTSAGIANEDSFPVPFDFLPPRCIVTDINYVPLMTPFLEKAKQKGLVTIPGLGMLLHQAVRGFELWFGPRPTVTQELYDLIASDIERKHQS